MPKIKGAKYRIIKSGKKTIRLAFVDGEVVEAKNMDTGEVHTPEEFKRDKRRKKKK